MSRIGSLQRSIPPRTIIGTPSAFVHSQRGTLQYQQQGRNLPNHYLGGRKHVRSGTGQNEAAQAVLQAQSKQHMLVGHILINGLLAPRRAHVIVTRTDSCSGAISKRGNACSLNTRLRSFSTHVARGSATGEASQRDGSIEDNAHEDRVSWPEFAIEPTRDELQHLVDTYPQFPGMKQKRRQGASAKHYPLAPRLVLSPLQEDSSPSFWPPHPLLSEQDGQVRNVVQTICKLVERPFGWLPLGRVWRLYSSLPSPRPRQLPPKILGLLFHHLAWVEYKHEEGAADRFMILLNDCRREGMKIHPSAWNTAVAYAARQNRDVTSDNVRKAVGIWKDMEASGEQATHVTFNILYDAAVRAGLYGLADSLHTELQARDMPLNRYFRTAAIFHAGKRKNGDAVRAAFRDLVNAGEVVDTAVMNCVMVSLVRAGEGAAAENVLARMKALIDSRRDRASQAGEEEPRKMQREERRKRSDPTRSGNNENEQPTGFVSGPRSWQGRKQLGKVLNATAETLRQETVAFQKSFFGTPFSTSDRREAVQAAAPLAPDERSYRILIEWHCERTEDWDRVKGLLAEMRDNGLFIYGGVYATIFNAFAAHGGYAGAKWSRLSLENVWQEFVHAVRHDVGLFSKGDEGDCASTVHAMDSVTKAEAQDAVDSRADGGFEKRKNSFDSHSDGKSPQAYCNDTMAQSDGDDSNHYTFKPLVSNVTIGDEILAPSRTNWQKWFYSGSAQRASNRADHDEFNAPLSSTFIASSSASEIEQRDPNSKYPCDQGPSMRGFAAHQLYTPRETTHEKIDESDPWQNEDDALPVSETARTPYLTPGLARAALQAFFACAGRKRMEEIREDIAALGVDRGELWVRESVIHSS